MGKLVCSGGNGLWVRGSERDLRATKRSLPPSSSSSSSSSISLVFLFIPPSISSNHHSNVPIFYTSGNHESSTSPTLAQASFPGVDDGGECGQAYSKQLLMPSPSGSQFLWYSTVKGSAFFIQLNSDQSVEPGSTQRAWLLSTLATVDRSKTPWLIVSLHRPLYSDTSIEGEVDRAAILTQALEPIFFENR
jgi:Calcineurin-like phosphoesterase